MNLFAIRIKHGIQVIEFYSSPTSLMTHLLPTFSTRYDLGPNGKNGVQGFLSNIGVLI